MENNMYENLCLSGGGIRGLAYVGAIEELEHMGLLSNFKRFAGTSIGSIFAALLACGFTADEIQEVPDTLNLSKFHSCILSKIYNIHQKLGMYSLDDLEQQMRQILRKRVDPDITLKCLFEQTEKELVIVSCCINRQEPVYFHHAAYPDVKLIDAIICSISVPFVFQPRKYTFSDMYGRHGVHDTSDYYIDGGVVENYPIWVFNDLEALYEGCLQEVEKEDINPLTLGMKLLAEDEANSPYIFDGRVEINSAITMAQMIINTILLQTERAEISPSYIAQTIAIQTGHVYFLDFSYTHEIEKSLIKSGKVSVRKYYNDQENSQAEV